MFLKPIKPSFRQIGFNIFLTWYQLPSCTTPLSGHAIDTQGWTMRRCSSCLNRVASKPHCPREPEIREILSQVGIEWQDPPAHEQDDHGVGVNETEDLEELSSESEEGEEEQVTDDEAVPIPLEGAGANLTETGVVGTYQRNNLVGYALVY